MKSTYRWLSIVPAVAATGLMAVSAFAAEAPSAAFAAHYQQNASAEASLMQQTQSLTVQNSETSALQQVVQTIGQQVTSLYGDEQSLVSARGTVPRLTQSSLATGNTLIRERNQLQLQLSREARLMQTNRRRRPAFLAAERAHARFEVKIRLLDAQINQLRSSYSARATWNSHPYAGGVAALQGSILELQKAEIHYTHEWIALGQSSAASSQTGSASAPAVDVPVPAGVTLPAGVPTAISAAFSLNGNTAQTVNVPATDLVNNAISFPAPTGLAAGQYTVTVTLTYSGSTVSVAGSYSVSG